MFNGFLRKKRTMRLAILNFLEVINI